MTVFRWNAASGQIDEAQVTTTIPHGFAGRNTTAEIAVFSDGRFLYVSNRGEDSIAQFAIDAASGQLRYVATTPTGGAKPRFFTLDPAVIGSVVGAPNPEPYTLVAMGPETAGTYPAPAQHLPRPPNNHLSYAITWYGLAVALLIIFGAWMRKALRS